MCVRDAPDLREGAIKRGMRREIGRRPQIAFDHLTLEIRDYHVGRGHLLIRNAAGLDHDETFLARDAARVPEGVDHQSAANQLEVRFVDLSSQRFQQSGLPARAPLFGAAPARCFRSPPPRNPAVQTRSTASGRADTAPDRSRLPCALIPRSCRPDTARPALLRSSETYPRPGVRRSASP